MCRIKIYATGDVVELFAGADYSSVFALVNYRVKQLVYTCIRAVHQNRLALFFFNSLLFGPLAFPNLLLFATSLSFIIIIVVVVVRHFKLY